MRKYEKPMMKIERFEAAASVADCNRKLDTSVTVYVEQDIHCAIRGCDDKVFMEHCQHNVSERRDKPCYFATYNGVEYLVWYDGKSDGQITSAGAAIQAGVGITEAGWHAAVYASVKTDYFTLS